MADCEICQKLGRTYCDYPKKFGTVPNMINVHFIFINSVNLTNTNFFLKPMKNYKKQVTPKFPKKHLSYFITKVIM